MEEGVWTFYVHNDYTGGGSVDAQEDIPKCFVQ